MSESSHRLVKGAGGKKPEAKARKQVNTRTPSVALTVIAVGESLVAGAIVGTLKYGHGGSDAIIAAGAVVSAIAAAFIAWFTVTLSNATEEIRRGADDTLTHQKEVSALELRAYVSWHAVELPDGGAVGRKFTFKNYGRTPATFVQISVNQKVASAHSPDLPEPEFTTEGEWACLMPEQATPPLPVPFDTLDLPDLARVLNGTHKHYIYGAIRYRDVFDTTNILTMRWELQGNVIVLSKHGNTVQYGISDDE